ncbi:anti-sigma factor [Arthrobacter sp. YD4]|uniref:anti-sigma factor n=1 Tax=Arthrobacter sp. YD4 TaxID=3058043 RepID=UPI0025B53731|nr:anti-sigma factor [Arthrobacter sp. YD4]MDN3936665.1 anti-sigma factor [Arthrobacter sp. YD4]
MAHCDEDLLALLALGERDATAEETLHLDSCGVCRDLLDGFRRTVAAARVDPAGAELAAPGGHNWAAIHGTLGLAPALAADPLAADAPAPAPLAIDPLAAPALAAPAPLRPSASRRRPEAPAPEDPPRTGTAGQLPRRAPWLLSAAAGILLGAAGAWTAWSVLGQSTPPAAGPAPSTAPAPGAGPTAAVIGEAVLTPLGGHSALGSALVEQLPDGTRQVVITLPEQQLAGYREVWLGSADLSRMVSLGVLGQGSQAFVVPGGLDLTAYPVLDVSDEPYDGDPAHSADSLARGKLSLRG